MFWPWKLLQIKLSFIWQPFSASTKHLNIQLGSRRKDRCSKMVSICLFYCFVGEILSFELLLWVEYSFQEVHLASKIQQSLYLVREERKIIITAWFNLQKRWFNLHLFLPNGLSYDGSSDRKQQNNKTPNFIKHSEVLNYISDLHNSAFFIIWISFHVVSVVPGNNTSEKVMKK